MQWGRKWGRGHEEQGFKHFSYWGDENYPGQHTGKLNVVKVRGVIKPCTSCKRRYNCAMYFSLTRNRMRHGEYSQGTNILHMCDIYVPDSVPGDIRSPQIHGRTSGKEPT